MAMNKKEQEMVEGLKTRLALRWPEKVSADVIPEGWDTLFKGYTFVGERSDHPRVEMACSKGAFHATGRQDKTDSQGSIKMYSTKVLALKALQYAVAVRCAALLRRVEKQIEDEEAKQL